MSLCDESVNWEIEFSQFSSSGPVPISPSVIRPHHAVGKGEPEGKVSPEIFTEIHSTLWNTMASKFKVLNSRPLRLLGCALAAKWEHGPYVRVHPQYVNTVRAV